MAQLFVVQALVQAVEEETEAAVATGEDASAWGVAPLEGDLHVLCGDAHASLRPQRVAEDLANSDRAGGGPRASSVAAPGDRSLRRRAVGCRSFSGQLAASQRDGARDRNSRAFAPRRAAHGGCPRAHLLLARRASPHRPLRRRRGGPVSAVPAIHRHRHAGCSLPAVRGVAPRVRGVRVLELQLHLRSVRSANGPRGRLPVDPGGGRLPWLIRL